MKSRNDYNLVNSGLKTPCGTNISWNWPWVQLQYHKDTEIYGRFSALLREWFLCVCVFLLAAELQLAVFIFRRLLNSQEDQ